MTAEPENVGAASIEEPDTEDVKGHLMPLALWFLYGGAIARAGVAVGYHARDAEDTVTYYKDPP